MQSLCRGLRGGIQNHLTGSKFVCSNPSGSCSIRGVSGWITSEPCSDAIVGRSTASGSLPKCVSRSFVTLRSRLAFLSESSTSLSNDVSSTSLSPRSLGSDMFKCGTARPAISSRFITTMGQSEESSIAPRIKFKRLDKTAKHIMQILDKEAVEGVRENKEIPDIKPGYLVQLKVEVPENKRRVSILKGIVIARRNAGLNTTFRIRRVVAGVGVESVFPLYSPNIKEMKVLDKKRVRRAKLYYLRDKINALKKL